MDPPLGGWTAMSHKEFKKGSVLKVERSSWIPGSYAPSIVREAQLLFKTIEKEGLQGGKGDNNWVV